MLVGDVFGILGPANDHQTIESICIFGRENALFCGWRVIRRFHQPDGKILGPGEIEYTFQDVEFEEIKRKQGDEKQVRAQMINEKLFALTNPCNELPEG
jgi:hypothetical protein